jgi:two-component system OmpR family sensor kinase
VAYPVHASFDRWWNGISLRAKVTGVTVLLLTLGLTLAGVGTMALLRPSLLEQVDARIEAVHAGLDRLIDFSDIRDFGEQNSGLNPYYFAAVSANGYLIEDNLSANQTLLRPVTTGLTLTSLAQISGGITLYNPSHTTEWRVIASPLRVGLGSEQATLLVGLNLRETNIILGRYGAIFFAFAFAVVVLGAVATQLLVRGAFAPLRNVERTAARFAAGDYSQRLGGATPNTEVGRLSRSLNTMLARIDRAFADRARTVDQMRRFVGDASHELRTPLVSLRGYAELYRMGGLQNPESVAQAMDRIEREAIRMGALVEDLVALARLDEARPLALAPVDLLSIAQDAALDATASAPDRRITVVVHEQAVEEPDPAVATHVSDASKESRRVSANTGALAFAGATLARLRRRRTSVDESETAPTPAPPLPEVGPIVLADENKVRQVVNNLIGNAMRFAPDQSPIEIVVEVDRVSRFGIISIVDHGGGIPPQLREKIFQRFWRSDTSRTRDTGGSGLGLAIVAGIITNHKGHVEVVETSGGGATFRVCLPLLPPPDPAPAA